MKKHFWQGHALPLPRGRILRCANVAADVADNKHFSVASNVAPFVAPSVASDVAVGERHGVASNVAAIIAQVISFQALNVASLLRQPLTKSLHLPLPVI
jgi:hypothetical protein